MKSLSYLNKFFFKYKYRFLLGILISLASRYLAVKVPEAVRTSIDVAHTYKLGTIGVGELKTALFFNILYIIGLALLSGVFTFLMRQTIIVTSRFIEYDLKNEIFKKYERFSMQFYKRNRTGDFMNRISDDVSKVRMYIGPTVMYTINMFILTFIAIKNMWITDRELTLYTLIPFPFLSIFIFVINDVLHYRSNLVQEQLSRLTTYCQEVFSGINVLKAFAIEPNIEQHFDELSIESREKNIGLFLAKSFFFPGMVLLIGLSNLIVIYVGGKHFAQGIISMGTIAEFVLYVNMLTWPVAIIGWVSATLKEASVSQTRINEFLNAEEVVAFGTRVFDGNFKEITLKKVSLTYEDTGITAIKDFNLTLKKGAQIGVLGKTGSGKSSLVSLLTRFITPTQGNICIDGIPIEDFTLDSLRKNIGLVPQDSFLFSETIADNIRFCDDAIAMEAVVKAAKAAQIHKDILEFSKGYETVLGERGVTLSGGQKQRLCIARALINTNFKVLLFDDVLSAVDTKTASKIVAHLRKITHDKTLLMISHQARNLKYMEEVLEI